MTGAYPAHREADVALRDGSTVHVRPVRPSDEPALVEFFGALSPESRGFRFFTAAASLEGAARLTVDVNYESHYGMIATRGDGEHLVGQGTYVATGPGRAEIAFAISDELKGQGVGTIMLGARRWGSSPMQVGPGSCAPTPARRLVSRCRRFPTR